MSSLPQGWHGIPVPSRNGKASNMNSTSSVPTIIRKKWNSPMSSEVPRSKLPSYRPSNVRSHKTPPTSNNISSKSGPKSSSSDALSENQPSLAKPSPSKQYKAEIDKLKKELTTLKTENSILKVKVRRVDDENSLKSKQIEKLKVELKASQKVESANSKKSKDSELLLLKQKCLRLEGALKEKDLALGRLDESSLRIEGNETKMKISERGEGDGMQKSLNETFTQRPTSRAQTSVPRSSQSIKTEVTKLRDMIHKLENSNQELQQQVKDKNEEIRRLKLHMKSQSSSKPSQTPIPKFTPKAISSAKPETSVPKKIMPKSLVQKQSSTKSDSSASSVKKVPTKSQVPKVNQVKKPSAPRPSLPKAPLKELNPTQKRNSTVVSRKSSSSTSSDQPTQVLSTIQIYGGRSKLPATQTSSTFVVTTPSLPDSEAMQGVENNLEMKAQIMRENIAAKKIQRSWRDHQKKNIQSEPSSLENKTTEKAMTFIISSIKHHKLRKTKLNMLSKRKNSKQNSPRLSVENENAIVEAIQAATKNLWAKESSVADSM